MELEKLIPANLSDCSKSELIDVIMTFVNQVAQLTEQNAGLQKENAAHVQCVSGLERRLALNSGKGLFTLFRLPQHLVVTACFSTTFCRNTELSEQNG